MFFAFGHCFSVPSGLLNTRRLKSAAPIRGISHLRCGPFGTFPVFRNGTPNLAILGDDFQKFGNFRLFFGMQKH